MEMYHGSYTDEISGHLGWCLTDDPDTAATYAHSDGWIATVDLDADDLHIVAVDDSYTADTNWAPGDDDLARYDADVIVYTDADERGREHRTWRIVSARALAACTITTITETEN